MLSSIPAMAIYRLNCITRVSRSCLLIQKMQSHGTLARGALYESLNDRGSFEAIARVSADVMQGVIVAPLRYWRDLE